MKQHSKTTHKISGQFVARRIEMLRSPAFRVLSLTARRILDRLEIEHANHGGRDNGKLPLTFRNLIEFGISCRDDIARGIRELCALGIVELTRRGRAGNGEFRAPNLFRLTYLSANGKKPTDEWRDIRTIEEAEQAARKSRKPVMENMIGPVMENMTVTGHGFQTSTPDSPVMDTRPLSRKDSSHLHGPPHRGGTGDHRHLRDRRTRHTGGAASFFHRTNKGEHHDQDD